AAMDSYGSAGPANGKPLLRDIVEALDAYKGNKEFNKKEIPGLAVSAARDAIEAYKDSWFGHSADSLVAGSWQKAKNTYWQTYGNSNGSEIVQSTLTSLGAGDFVIKDEAAKLLADIPPEKLKPLDYELRSLRNLKL